MAALRTVVCLALIAVSSSQASNCSYFGLLQHLKLASSNNYLENMRPVKNWTSATLVQLDMLLYGILQVDEKSQTITNHIWINMQWNNDFLRWDPSRFCGIKVMTLPRSMLWIPDIIIQEDASDTGSIQDGALVTLYSNGTVKADRRQRLTYTCELKLTMFPFDKQSCDITFLSQSSDAAAIMLGTVYNDTTLSSLSERIMITQGEWKLNDLKTEYCIITDNASSPCKLKYKVFVERKPMLYVINFIVPLFYLLILDLTSFFISESRGEKLSFKVTILLSISVLLLILQEMLPSTEDSLPMIATYCVAIFALVGLSVLEAMLVSFLVDLDSYCASRRSAKPQADAPVEDDFVKVSAGVQKEVQVKPDKVYLPLSSPGGRDLLQLILDEVRAARQSTGRTSEEKRRYKQMAEIIDHFFFIFYFLTVVVFLLYMYLQWMRNLV